MSFLLENCIFKPLTQTLLDECDHFTCGDEELDAFFYEHAVSYEKELLGKSYCFTLEDSPHTIVCIFTISNDSIRVDNIPGSRKKQVKKNIPDPKQMRRYPAVLVGRLGIQAGFKGRNIGTELMDFIKTWFISPSNKTGCRFIVVDAYNKKECLAYYEKNRFAYLFSSEDQEAEHIHKNKEGILDTRFMYFDLIQILPAETIK